MKLTRKDLLETLLAVAAVVVTFAVTQGWGWALLGSTRAGIAALAVIGVGMCVMSGTEFTSFKGPFVMTASVLGGIALVLIVAGLVTASQTILVLLCADMVALWMTTTIHHMIGHEARTPAATHAAT